MIEERETVDELVVRLQGSCMETFDSTLYTMDELGELDTQIFECMVCGWWYENGDFSTNPDDEADTCSNCETEEDDE